MFVKEMVEYQRNDIVRLGDSKFEELKGQLWFSDNAFVVAEVEKDGKVSLNELNETVSASEILPLPISKKHAGNVYYDPIIAASIIGPDDANKSATFVESEYLVSFISFLEKPLARMLKAPEFNIFLTS